MILNELPEVPELREHSYFPLTRNSPDLTHRLRHNLRLLQRKEDQTMVQYLAQQLGLSDDLMTVDPETYQLKKLKLKLKVSDVAVYQASPELAQMLGMSSQKQFTHRGPLLKLVHAYLYRRGLQKGSKIQTTDLLDQLVGSEELTYFNLPEHLSDRGHIRVVA